MKKAIKPLLLSALLVANVAFAQGTVVYGPELLMSRFASWGIDPEKTQASINLSDSWQKFKKNKDVVVAVIDTGIQLDHPFLKDNIHVINGNPSKQNFGVDFSSGSSTNTPFDQHGHGTHVAGIVKSVFPEVRILTLKYYNPAASGQANLAATIRALKYAVDHNVDIINYSGGGPESSQEELKILKEAERKGILIIAAAGNERSNIDEKRNAYYPASYGLSNIITVGAYDDMLNIIPSSNYGKKSVDIAAPGHRIRSAIPGGGAAYMTGTSQATAFVSGVVALIKSKHPQMKFDQIKNIVLSSSNKVPNFEGKILGGGKLDAAKALVLAEDVSKKISNKTKRSVANH